MLNTITLIHQKAFNQTEWIEQTKQGNLHKQSTQITPYKSLLATVVRFFKGGHSKKITSFVFSYSK